MSDTTQEQAKLTLKGLKEIANGDWADWYSYQKRDMARALLALDTALRNGCQGCKEGLKSVRQQGTDAWMHFGNWSEDGPGMYRWAYCRLTDEQRAALLDKGDVDAS